MSRYPGTLNFAANFEPAIQAPLDARMKVDQYADLVNPSTWNDLAGNSWIYQGALVVVANDPSSGIYWLKTPDFTDFANWEVAGSATPFDPSALYDYVDGSLAARDSSITDLYSRIQIADSSIAYLVRWNTRLDSSINDLYAKLSADTSGGILNGQNIGNGDASVFSGKSGPFLQFRELKGTGAIRISSSDNVILINANYSSSIDGGVWITNISPFGSGNVGEKVFSSDGMVLDSCLTDTESLIVSVIAIPGHTNYKPYIYIDNVPITLSQAPDKPVFIGTGIVTLQPTDTSVTVVHEDGAQWSTIIARDIPPVILSANLIGNYPGTQTELKAGDTFQINIVTDVPIDQVTLDNYGAFNAQQFTVSGTNVTITGTVANRGNFVQTLGFSLHVRKSTGSISTTYLSTSHGSVERVDVLKLNNLYPTITFGSVVYPGTQQAIKSTETATVNNIVTNFDTILYSSPTNELLVSNTSTYETTKVVTYQSGTYNVTNNNLRIIATRAANNASTTGNTLVQIANVLPIINILGTSNRLRSGGADGTAVQSHTITIQSDQRLLEAPITGNIPAGQGTWSGSWAGGPSNWTRSLLVNDADIKGSYTLSGLMATNLSGMVQGNINSGATYTLGGFVSRNITLEAFKNEANMNVQATNYNNVTLTWGPKALPIKSPVNTNPPIADAWCLTALNTNPTTIRILDTNATSSVSQASTITIQETA